MISWTDLVGVLEIKPFDGEEPKWPEFRRYSPFRAEWASTIDLLSTEINMLDPKVAILECAIQPKQLRNDGMLRSGQKPEHPGVRLTLVGTKHGDLRYPCGTFNSMEANVRAIAMSLEALRKVDRYGVVKDGQQYKGFAQIEAAQGSGSVSNGKRLIAEAGGDVKEAMRRAHPDHGGSDGDFIDVKAAKDAREGA